MTTKNLKCNDELVEASFNLIRLTPELIEEINMIQTGGTQDGEIAKDFAFDNLEIENQLDRLVSLNDFIVELFDTTPSLDTNEIMNHLTYICELKKHFKAFRV